ncbi:hypothetical protein AACH06_11330 [Ideonella sp. DXS29W]|uniref:Cip1-like core domain-containing protein n=1 Tax=Ideonella lacteola TaxID=2984193 RepID=A0ABU9BR63_9BURK
MRAAPLENTPLQRSMTTLSGILLSVLALPASAAPEAASPTSSPTLACGFALCDGFESAAPGGAPDSALWTVGAANCTGTGQATIDNTVSHKGKQSLKVTSTGGYCNHIFAATPIPGSLGQKVFGRFYVRFAEALGDGHVTFLAMKDSNDNQRDLRMGGQNRILMWNRESDDATLPVLSPAGVALSVVPTAGTWHCIEFMVNGKAGAMKNWFNSAAVEGLRVDTTPTPEIDSQWLARGPWNPAPVDFRIGWESYAGQPMTLWFDDVVLGSKRVGCK